LTTIASLSPQTRRNLGVLFTAGLLFWTSLASLLPTIPLYVKSLGADDGLIGIVMASFAIGLLLLRPQFGKLADSKGRKIVLLMGIVVAAIAPVLHISTQSIPLLIGVRAFHGLSIAAFTTAYSALVVDIAPPENRGELIGYMSLVNPVGMAIGPAVGGYLQKATSFEMVFFFATAIGLLSLMLGSQVKAPGVSAKPRETNQSEARFWELLASDRIRVPTITMLLIGTAFGAIATFVPLYIESMKLDLNPGLFYTSAAVSSFMVRFVAGKASDRYGRGLFITIGLACYAIALLLLWRATTVPSFLLSGLLEGMGGGLFLPIMIALVADRSEAFERGRIFALFVSGFDLGIALAGPIFGSVAGAFGYQGAYAVAFWLAIAAVVVFVLFCSKSVKQSIRFAFGKGKDPYALPRISSAIG
jgi:MFS family permease